MRSLPRLGSGWLVALTLVAAAPATQALECGDEIGPKGKFALDADIGPCTSATDPALRVVGPVSLDMAGFRILCDTADTAVGILVEGSKAKVFGGGADGCAHGLLVEGVEGHRIEDFVATRSTGDGIVVRSNHTKLRRVAATGSMGSGITVEGNINRVQDSEALDNMGNGFWVPGSMNTLTRVTASGNHLDGVGLAGGFAKVKDSRFTGNLEDGVGLAASFGVVSRNVVVGNGDGDDVTATDAGIDVTGSISDVVGNVVIGNDPVGILLTDQTSATVVKGNASLGNTDTDAEDEETNCGLNTWGKNRVGTTEADGLPGHSCIPRETGPDVVACGDTIAPKSKIELGADIGPCAKGSADPALTIVGPATVDMAGFRLACDDGDPPDHGIRIQGKGVKLRNGVVSGCGIGLRVEGEGSHVIELVVSLDNDGDGFLVDSDRNRLVRVAGNHNGADGIDLDGSSNKIDGATVIGNGEQGIESDGDKNRIRNVNAVDNAAEGLLVGAGRDNRISRSAFLGNDGDGVELITGGNKIDRSIASRNGQDLGSDAGFDSRNDTLDAKGNQLKSNRAWDNPGFGVRSGGHNDKIQKSTALGNGVDAADDDATCAGNAWKKNVFGTSAADGASDPPCID